MKLSVIILNYNVKNFLQLCIESVEKAIANIEAEIIVVDNASIDGSMQMVAEKFPQIKRIQNNENLGFSKANNQAVKEAIGEYVCILNPDTVVAEDTFEKTLNIAEGLTDLGALGVKLIDGTGHFLPESKRQLPTPDVAFSKLIGKTNSYYANQLNDDDFGTVDVLVGAFMLCKKKRYEEVGGFDENYFMYGEDIDLSFKFLKAGYPNYYYGATSVLHFKGESTSKDSTYRKRFYGAMQLFYDKHFGQSKWRKKLVSLGLKAAETAHGFSSKQEQYLPTASTYIYIGRDARVVPTINKLKDKTAIQVEVNQLNELQLKHTQLVLDAESLSYKNILQLMETYNHNGNTFRIKPKTADFILGSDTSTSKGEVLELPKLNL